MITGLHHLVLMCRDTEAARRWYEMAGFEYLRGHDGMHWLRLGASEVMLHPAERGSGGSGLFLHAAVDDVRAHFRRAVESGLSPADHQQPGIRLSGPVQRPWGDLEFELEDPEGHRWAFTER
jgi:uncharacterized glyoxalase superfamily protein PhnB